MRTGRNMEKVIDLLEALMANKHQWLSATNLSFAANMSHEATLSWLYALHDAKLVECLNESPRKWRWKQ